MSAATGITQRIHIVSSSPRSGTSLLRALMHHCFEIDGYSEKEISILVQPDQPYNVFLSKKPDDIRYAAALLKIDPNLWFISLTRDPRDTIVSRHHKSPDKYWTNLRVWKERYALERALHGHPRFLQIRYEDLASKPDEVQDWLAQKLPFLRKRIAFSEFHEKSAVTRHTEVALGGVRPVGTGSVGRWRQHKPRVAAQIALHGSITEPLVEMGYETDDRWLAELKGITPDNEESRTPEFQNAWQRFKDAVKSITFVWRYRLKARRRLSARPS